MTASKFVDVLWLVDVIENIMRDMSDQSKSRGQIIRELKKQGLIESAKDLKRPNGWVTGGQDIRNLKKTKNYFIKESMVYKEHVKDLKRKKS